MSTVTQRQQPRSNRSTVLNAIIGAVVSVVLSFIPLSPALGGFVAGYLQRDTRVEGAKVGALSGLLAAIPFVLLVVFVVSLITIVPAGADGLSLGLVGVFAAAVLFLFAAVYTVGLGAVGGYLGGYVATETEFGR